MSTSPLAGLMLFAVAGSANAQAAASPNTTALRPEIEKELRDVGTASARGDMKAVASRYTDRPVIRGGRDVGAGPSGDRRILRLRASSQEVDRRRLRSYSAGEQRSHLPDRTVTLVVDSPERKSSYQVLAVWQRQPDRRLKMVLLSYHLTDPPASGGQ